MKDNDKNSENLLSELQGLKQENIFLTELYNKFLTECGKKENALRESEENYRLLLELAPDAFFQGNREGYFIMANKKATLLTGYTNEELLTMGMRDLFPESVINKKPLRFDLLDKGEKVTSERNMLCKGGSIITVEMTSLQMPNKTYQSFIRDISDHKQANENLRESEERYRMFIEQTSDGVFRMEFDEPMRLDLPVEELIDFIYDHGIVVECNHAFMKMYDTENPDDIIGKRQIDFHGGRDNPSNRAVLRKYILNNFNVHQEETLEFDIKGNMRYFSNSSVGIFKDGNLIRIWGTQTDITEKKKSELELIKAKEKAEESDRLKSAFLANMSHEIRTPMNGILGFAYLLKEPHLTGEQQQEYVSIIEKSGNRMLNIINDIIDISKIESGTMKVSLAETNVNEQIDYVYTFFKPEAEKKGLHLHINSILQAGNEIIISDREKLYAILTNLTKNAIKFTDAGSVELGCARKGDFIEFFIKDTGVGIPKDRHQVVFERFIQADVADKRAFQGAGLGLSIAKAFVEMLGGMIWFESQENKGSIFYFTVPCCNEMESKPVDMNSSADKTESNINNLKVLIVEDDEASDLYITLLLKIYHCTFLHARTGLEAIDICLNNPDIDLIMMDIKMPEMNGYEATIKIRRFNRRVIIIAQTAFALTGDKEKAIESGCDDYITKPINKETLGRLIQKYFNNRQLLR